MSRLPRRLQPWWPVLKRTHRLLTLLAGLVFRRLPGREHERRLPTAATTHSSQTARREPETVTLHPGGPAELLVRAPARGTPPGHWVLQQSGTARIPARYVLEVTGGRLTGDYAAVTTPGGTLDYQTSGYFGIESWREHPIFLRPDLGEVEHVAGTVLSLTARGSSENYYHFLYDALARLQVFEEAMPETRVDAVVVPHRAGYQRQLLDLAGVTGPFLQPRRGLTYRADRLLVPSTPNQDLDAPWPAVRWLREHLKASARSDTPRRLFVTRGRTPHTRRYVEEPELRPWLEQHGFAVVDPGTFTVQEQIDLFANAEVVVGPHGAGLTNITFCQPGTRVLELFADGYVHLGLRNIAAAVDGVDYHYLVAEGSHRAGRPMQGIYDDVTIPVPVVRDAVAELLERP